MIKTYDMKDILAKKLKDENTYFQKSDISIRKQGDSFKIVIKDYEHITFIIKFENDEFSKEISLWRQYTGEKRKSLMYLEPKHNDESMKIVLLNLGYYIGTRF